MKHLAALVIKFTIVGIVLLSVLGAFNIRFTSILVITALLVVPTYIIGDLFIYRRFGNVVATAVDFLTFLPVVFAFLYFLYERSSYSLIAALFASIIITLVEALFHGFIIARFFKTSNHRHKETDTFFPGKLRTEFAEENESAHIKRNKK